MFTKSVTKDHKGLHIIRVPLECTDNLINVPLGARILSVACMKGTICLFMLADPKEEGRILRRFHATPSNRPIPQADMIYLATVPMLSGDMVAHIFEEDGAEECKWDNLKEDFDRRVRIKYEQLNAA